MVEATERRIVVGVDGSPQSEQALRWAAQLAVTFDARLEVVGAWDVPAVWGYGTPPVDWNPSADMASALRATVAKVFGADGAPVPLVAIEREGGAARVLLDASAGALMVVVGSRGHGGFAGLLLGSVSASVAEHAACPVLIVHGDEPLPPATP